MPVSNYDNMQSKSKMSIIKDKVYSTSQHSTYTHSIWKSLYLLQLVIIPIAKGKNMLSIEKFHSLCSTLWLKHQIIRIIPWKFK